MSNVRFKAKFPKITLPPNFGGCPAIVVLAVGNAREPNVMFAMCIDINGTVHQNVPLSMIELKAAASRPATFLEVEDDSAPVVGITGSKLIL